jgi:hypothetical protein
MTELNIIECTSPTELFRQYDGQHEPQPAYIELDLVHGTLLADYNAEIGNAAPATVFHGLDRRYRIPVLTADAANRVMQQIAPLARRILADSEEEWDGNNTVARLGEDARAAEEEIENLLGLTYPHENPFDEDDLVMVWGIDSAVNGCEAEEYEITPSTTDERLEEIEREILADLATCNGGSVAICPGLSNYLKDLRDNATQEEDA